MIKNIASAFLLLITTLSFAQQGTSSPYSFYGIGDVRFKGTIENRAMGGITSQADSIHVNLQNPAYFSSIRLTSFTVGATFGSGKIESNSDSSKAQRTSLDYIAAVIPTKKMGFAFGVMPYSSVGYNVLNTTNTNLIRQYSGSGGINKVFFGTAYSITPNFSIGADIQYNFGRIETKAINAYSGVEYATREINVSNATGVNYNLGLRYQRAIKKNYFIYTALMYSPESTIRFKNDRNLTLISWTSSGGEIGIQDESLTVADTKLKLPSKFDFALGFGKKNHWSFGANVLMQNSSNFGNRYNEIDNVKFENATRYSVGGYFIPNYKSFTNYFQRVVYRAGFRYENTGLVINQKSITDTAITAGLGLPVRGTFSNMNLVFEYGMKGTQANGLVRERYFNVGFSLSFNDQWFQKRKFD